MTETTQKLSALILIADGSEEIEFVTPYEYVPHLSRIGQSPRYAADPRLICVLISVLTRAGVSIKSCGVKLENPFFAQ